MVGLIGSAILARPAAAFDFDEHALVCRQAYEEACTRIRNVVASKTKETLEEQRLDLACEDQRAEVFGQACAISGDLVSRPEELNSALGGVHATNELHYYSLALYNAEHFQPQSLDHWLRYQTDAMASATAAATSAPGPSQITQFQQAFYLAAFADHFLADSFATGHMGFNRQASSAGAAKTFHDFWNDQGRWLRSRDKSVWFGRGDGHLKDGDRPTSPDGFGEQHRHVFEALTHAVSALLYTYVSCSTTDAAKETLAAWRSVPAELGRIPTREHVWYWFDVSLLQAEDAAKPSLDQWDPIALVRQPARYPFVVSAEYTVQYRPNLYTEKDASARLTFGPYPGILDRHIYASIGVGYGRLSSTGGSELRNRLVLNGDIDVPIVWSANGLAREALVFGLSLSDIDRRSLFLAARTSFELGQYRLDLTAGLASLVYDPSDSYWRAWRPALMTSISGGYISSTYLDIESAGVPAVREIHQSVPGYPRAVSLDLRHEQLIQAHRTYDAKWADSAVLTLRLGPPKLVRIGLFAGFGHLSNVAPESNASGSIPTSGVAYGGELSRAVWSPYKWLFVDVLVGLDAYRWDRWSALGGVRTEISNLRQLGTDLRGSFFSLDLSGGIEPYAAYSSERWSAGRRQWRIGVGSGFYF